jgi:hypothetical protein
MEGNEMFMMSRSSFGQITTTPMCAFTELFQILQAKHVVYPQNWLRATNNPEHPNIFYLPDYYNKGLFKIGM